MIASAWSGLWMPASSITISFEPCFVTIGSLTPSLLIRCSMMFTARSSWVELSFTPAGGCAFRTTSRPPCRSRPLRIGLWIGEPGIPIATTSASVARIRPSRIRCERRSDTELRPGSLAFVLRNRGLCGLLVRLFVRLVFRLLVVLGLDLPGDRAPGDANHRPGGDLEVELVVAHRLDAAVEPACGDDLVPPAHAREQFLMRALPAA